MYNNPSWSTFLEFIGDEEMSYADKHGNYYVYYGQLVCVLGKDSSDAVDFETNYQSDAIMIAEGIRI